MGPCILLAIGIIALLLETGHLSAALLELVCALVAHAADWRRPGIPR